MYMCVSKCMYVYARECVYMCEIIFVCVYMFVRSLLNSNIL